MNWHIALDALAALAVILCRLAAHKSGVILG